MQEKPLLILDLDETLVHACERDSEKDLRIRQHRQPDFFVGEYAIYKRPVWTTFSPGFMLSTRLQSGQKAAQAMWSPA